MGRAKQDLLVSIFTLLLRLVLFEHDIKTQFSQRALILEKVLNKYRN